MLSINHLQISIFPHLPKKEAEVTLIPKLSALGKAVVEIIGQHCWQGLPPLKTIEIIDNLIDYIDLQSITVIRWHCNIKRLIPWRGIDHPYIHWGLMPSMLCFMLFIINIHVDDILFGHLDRASALLNLLNKLLEWRHYHYGVVGFIAIGHTVCGLCHPL